MNNIIEFNINLLIDEYSNYVFTIIDNIEGSCLSYEEKEEIISDTFYLLWKNQTLIERNLKSYLASIARHCTIRKLKSLRPTLELKEDIFQTDFQYVQLDDLLTMKE